MPTQLLAEDVEPHVDGALLEYLGQVYLLHDHHPPDI